MLGNLDANFVQNMSDFVLFTKPRKFEGAFEFLDILKGYESILFSIPCKFWD